MNIEEHAHINAKLDNFTCEDAGVHPIDVAGKRSSLGLLCGNIEIV